jgi:aldehyde dehydrogenase (NAD+)
MKKYRLWVDGQHVDPVTNQWMDTLDPFSGKAWASIPRSGADDVSRAVAAATRAMNEGPWTDMTASERGRIMRRIGDLVTDNAQRLAKIEVQDNGKLIVELQGQMRYLSDYWHYFAGLADKIEGAVTPVEKRNLFGFTRHEPVGVVAALTAWNAPLTFLTIKCAPALAAGCAIVLKPSEFASTSSLEFAALTKMTGLPDGVLNVVTGLGAEVGSALVEHPDVAAISFTGSEATGVKIYEAAARGMKRVHLELGGKSPNIVFADADLEMAAVGAVTAIFGGAGQMCTAGSRLLVQNSIKEGFTKRLLELAREIKLGDPMSPQTEMGPITTEPQFRKVLDYIAVAKSEGARCLLGGAPAIVEGGTGGQFIAPTIFTDVTTDMRIAQEEIFGPVLSIIGFDDERDAVRIGNDVAFGLAAGVWTGDIARVFRVSRSLKVGTVWVNTYRSYTYTLPFGGMKRSGVGRESGIEAVYEFLETKSVMISTAAEPPANVFAMR